MSVELLVHFNGQYWVGVMSVCEGVEVRAVRVVFGAEPTDPEVYVYVHRHGRALLEAAARAAAAVDPRRSEAVMNPKRAARQAAREARAQAASTAAQEALRLEREASKQSRLVRNKSDRDADAARKRELRVRKAKAKHRGH